MIKTAVCEATADDSGLVRRPGDGRVRRYNGEKAPMMQ